MDYRKIAKDNEKHAIIFPLPISVQTFTSSCSNVKLGSLHRREVVKLLASFQDDPIKKISIIVSATTSSL